MRTNTIRLIAAGTLAATLVASGASAQMRGAAPQPASPMPGSMQSAPAVPSNTAPSTATSSTPSTTSQTTTTGAPTGTATNTSASGAAVTSGLSVKDNTGAEIGQVSAVSGGMATIKMGTQSFQVPTGNLAVQNGAASINLTRAQIAAQLPPQK